MCVGFITKDKSVMVKVAFTLIGGQNWTGGHNYLLNLLRALSEHAAERVQPFLFFGTDVDEFVVSPFKKITGAKVVSNVIFNRTNQARRSQQALLLGCDKLAATEFSAEGIDVVFETGQFYGWNFPMPVVAWIPDFQHRHLKYLFNFRSYWRRDLGLRAQILSGRQIMLSSEDARKDCEQFYPYARGRTHVIPFAVSPTSVGDAVSARAVAIQYGLPEHFFFLPNQFWAHKNHECVIEALKILKEKGRRIVVATSGQQADPRDPRYFPRIKSLIETNGLTHHFRLLGLIPYEHIIALMQACVALINPSLFEGWSTTVEEAKGTGTPMILSALRVHKEQIENATFFDPHSPHQLAAILGEFLPVTTAERLSMGANATQETVHNMKIFADKLANLFESCAK
jgi:glycosyltransferase involved in cell wall biosynthesis